MNGIDEIVRDTLHAQVQHPPMMDPPADRIITDARRVRRRRAIAAACACVAVLASGITMLTTARDGGDTTTRPADERYIAPSPASPVATSRLGQVDTRPDLLVNRSQTLGWQGIYTADNRTIPLAGVAGIVKGAYETADGWLIMAVGNGTDIISLWFVQPSGAAHRVIERSDTLPAVAPDGLRFAWRSDGNLHVARRSGTSVTRSHSSPVPADVTPVAFTGTAVVLARHETGPGVTGYDVWLPDKGDYSTRLDSPNGVVLVYRPAVDGSLFGLVRTTESGNLCLAELDLDNGLKPKRTVCEVPLSIGKPGLVSPDGRWLAAPSLKEDMEVILVDLHAVFDGPSAHAGWVSGIPVVWISATTLVVDRDGTLMTAVVSESTAQPIRAQDIPAGQNVQPVLRP